VSRTSLLSVKEPPVPTGQEAEWAPPLYPQKKSPRYPLDKTLGIYDFAQ